MKVRLGLNIVLIISLLHIILAVSPTQSQTTAVLPIVRAVMFWMNGCPHYHDVLEDVLLPLQEK